MSLTALLQVYVFILAGFVGFFTITRVPPLLHTPLMSATNAISGISLVGSIVLAGSGHDSTSTILGVIAVTSATINVVGGFMITDRMLRMFRKDDGAKVTKVTKGTEGPGANAAQGPKGMPTS